MRNYMLAVVLLIYCISCNSSAKESSNGNNITVVNDANRTVVRDIIELPLKEEVTLNKTKPMATYKETIASLAVKKAKLVSDYNAGKIKIDSVERFFTMNLVYNIFPYWYGTPWTFGGHTNVPNQGKVACGYFVSTTLKHFGMNVNRYKMAQQAALTGLKMVAPSDKIIQYSNDSFGVAVRKIQTKLKPGIYMIGFDYHVGFLYIDSAGLHFIHSNYMDPVAVVKEDALLSPAFNNTKNVYLAKITNTDFLIKWMKKEEFTVPK